MSGKWYTADFKAEAIKQRLTINSKEHALIVEPETPLLWALPEHLSLTGANYARGTAHLNCRPVRALTAERVAPT